MDLVFDILQSINWVELIKYAIVVGAWEGAKIGIKKLAKVRPTLYLKIFMPLITGTILLLFPESIATTLHTNIWIVYIVGAILVAIVVLPYLIFGISWLRWKKNVVWKKR